MERDRVSETLGLRLAFEASQRIELLDAFAHEYRRQGRPREKPGVGAAYLARVSEVHVSDQAALSSSIRRLLEGSAPHARGQDPSSLLKGTRLSEVQVALGVIDHLIEEHSEEGGWRVPAPALLDLFGASQRVVDEVDTMVKAWSGRGIGEGVIAIGAELLQRSPSVASASASDALDGPAADPRPIEPSEVKVLTAEEAHTYGAGASTVDLCFDAAQDLLRVVATRDPVLADDRVFIAATMLEPSSLALSLHQRQVLEDRIDDLLARGWDVYHQVATTSSPEDESEPDPAVAAVITEVLLRKVGRNAAYFPYVSPPEGNEVVAASRVGALWMTRPSGSKRPPGGASVAPGIAVTALVSERDDEPGDAQARTVVGEALAAAEGDRDDASVGRLFESTLLPEGFYLPTNDVVAFDQSISAAEFWPGDRLAIKTYPMVSSLPVSATAAQFTWWKAGLKAAICDGDESRHFARFARLSNVVPDDWDAFIRAGGLQPDLAHDSPAIRELVGFVGLETNPTSRSIKSKILAPSVAKRRDLVEELNRRITEMEQTRLARHYAFKINCRRHRYLDIISHEAIRSYALDEVSTGNPIYGAGGLDIEHRIDHLKDLIDLLKRSREQGPDSGFGLAIPPARDIVTHIDVNQTWVIVTTNPGGQSDQAHFLLENREPGSQGGRIVGKLTERAAQSLFGAKAVAAKFHLIWDSVPARDRKPESVISQLEKLCS